MTEPQTFFRLLRGASVTFFSPYILTPTPTLKENKDSYTHAHAYIHTHSL